MDVGCTYLVLDPCRELRRFPHEHVRLYSLVELVLALTS